MSEPCSASFTSLEEVGPRMKAAGYLCDDKTAAALYLMDGLQKPLLVEGPAGVGKTDLSRALAEALGLERIRLQCYEGLDESKALYEWEYGKQLLYAQMLKEKIGELVSDAKTLSEAADRIGDEESAFFSERFLLPRPLLKALLAEKRCVLLIDEADKADPEFEAFLLEALSDYQVSIPEIGPLKAKVPPLVVLTSNDTRELSDALKRRCLYLYLNYPSPERELEIVRAHHPEASEALAGQAVKIVSRAREMDLKKPPSVGETLDWIRALTLLNASRIDRRLLRETLNVLLKYEDDLQRASGPLEDAL